MKNEARWSRIFDKNVLLGNWWYDEFILQMMRVSINDNFTERKFILLFQNVSIIFSNFMGWSLSNPVKSEGFYKRFDRAPRPNVMIKVSKVKE